VRNLLLPALLLALTASGPALAADKKRVHPTEARPDDLICTYEKTTGSHLKKRVCATRSDREQRARADQDAMGNIKRGGGGSAGSRD